MRYCFENRSLRICFVLFLAGLFQSPLSGGVVITEIMYNPLPGMDEWIEIYNDGTGPVDISNWRLGEESDSLGHIISGASFVLDPGAYLAIAPSKNFLIAYPDVGSHIIMEKGFPRLNNDGDTVFLFNAEGAVSDAVQYSAEWGGMQGISLERIRPGSDSQDPENWSSSVAPPGGTPGRQNSVFFDEGPESVQINVSPNPFSPDGDGIEDHAVISYRLPMETAFVHLSIYDRRGRLCSALVNHRPSGSAGETVWDGKSGDGKTLPIGMYILFLEAIQESKGRVVQGKAVVVLATGL